jgi:hypothetical protein
MVSGGNADIVNVVRGLNQVHAARAEVAIWGTGRVTIRECPLEIIKQELMPDIDVIASKGRVVRLRDNLALEAAYLRSSP